MTAAPGDFLHGRRTALAGRKGGKGGGGDRGSGAKESPNTLQSRATARVLDLVSEGPIGGLVDGLKSVFFDDTPVQNDDGSFNFAGVTITERIGLPDQEPIPGFPAVESEFAVGLEVKADTPIVRSVTNPEADAIRVKIRLPSLTKQDTANGNLSGSAVTIAIDVAESGGDFVETRRDTISGKCTSPYERAYRIERPAGTATWQVRVRRITPDSTTVSLRDNTFWSSYTEIIDAKLIYPDSAIYGVEADAEQFGQNIPSRSYELIGLNQLEVPSNYDPDTRFYSGIWDGTFKLAWTDNPAWILYALLTHDRFGLGQFIRPEHVDKWALFEIAKYCDELVPDGFGFVEPRFTFNAVMSTQEDAYAALQSIASSFLGMTFWGPGAVTAVQDSPADVYKLVTNANVIDGLFNYEGSGLKARHSVAIVIWNNPEERYRPNREYVERPDLIERYGLRETTVLAYGCTSRGQARRRGNWILDSEENESETVSYRAGFDHADVRPGHIVAVSDSHVAGVRVGGRVKSATLAAVTIDSAIALDAAETYTLSVVLPDGTVAGSGITNAPGEAVTLTLETALPAPPIAGAMWVVTASNVAPRLFRVISNMEAEPHLYEITALLHDPTKYARVEQGVHLAQPPFTLLPSGPLAGPTNFTPQEFIRKAGPTVIPGITLSWTPSVDPRVRFYQVERRGPGDEHFKLEHVTTGNSIDIFDVTKATYDFQVFGLDTLGRKTDRLTITVTLTGVFARPADVANFNVTINGNQASFSWDPDPAPDIVYRQIRFSPVTVGASWDGAVDLIQRVAGQQTSAAGPALVGTYLIKAFDSSGQESENATAIVSTVAAIAGFNFVQSVTESPGFAGAKSGVEVDAGLGGLIISDVTGEDGSGLYTFANAVDLGAVYTSRVTAGLVIGRANLAQDILTTADILTLGDVFGVPPGTYAVFLEVRTTDDDPAGTPAWSAWRAFIVGDYTARAFEFRIRLESYAIGITPVVQELAVTVDMPDRVVGQDNLACPATGLAVSFTPAFKVRPAIAVSGQDMATGDYFTVTAASRTGFTVQFFDSADAGVARTFDFVAKGYGGEG